MICYIEVPFKAGLTVFFFFLYLERQIPIPPMKAREMSGSTTNNKEEPKVKGEQQGGDEKQKPSKGEKKKDKANTSEAGKFL